MGNTLTRLSTLALLLAALSAPFAGGGARFRAISRAPAQFDDRCLSARREVFEMVEQFRRATGDGASIANAAAPIRTFFTGRELDPCLRAMREAYALASLASLHTSDSGQTSLRFLKLFQLAGALVGRGWVKFGDDAPWLHESSYYGAYSCSERRIYLDESLDPYNLGAVFVHELSHLVRDRFRGRIGTAEAPVNFVDVIADETIAALEGGWAQFRYVSRKDAARPSGQSLFSEMLFSRRDGTFQQLASEATGSPTWLGNWPSLRELAPVFEGPLRAHENRLTSLLVPTVNSVARAYFPDLFFPEVRRPQLILLDEIYREEPTLEEFLETRQEVAHPATAHGNYPAAWELLLDDETGLMLSGLGNLSVMSPRCRGELDHADAFENYREMKEGTRPTKEGTRPTKEGTRPTKEGTRPTKEGTRPTKEGTRPGFGLRLCHPYGPRP
jgi:hypothetical protein